jgi:Tol biopolymer transport system component
VALALLAAPCAGACGAGEDLIAPEPGGLEVSTESSGAGDDPDGIVVVVDGVARYPLLPDTTLRLPGMSLGGHTLAVEELDPGCTLTGPNPRDVIVVPDSVVQVVLEISCAATGGGATLAANVVTGGADPDADGFVVLLDALAPHTIAATDSIAFTALSADSHVVRLAGVADRCTVAGANPWAFQVDPPDTATITWEVTCWPSVSGRIAFVRIEPEGGSPRNLFMIDAGGTGLTRLTGPDDNTDQYPDWSPDGTQIAYVSDTNTFDSRLRVLDVVRRTLRELPIGSLSASVPQWSPDGTQLSFESFDSDAFQEHVYLVNADGSGAPRRLAQIGSERNAAWSPDGNRLAFIGAAQFLDPERVYVIARSGDSPLPVSPSGLEPAFAGGDLDWSPDGSRIVFSAAHPLGQDFGSDLYVVGIDGNGLVNLTASPPFSSNVRPRWSPDGRVIAYTCSDVNRSGTIGDICTIPSEGGPRTNLTNHLEFYSDFGWSPDGSRLVFARPGQEDDFREDLFMIHADGSGLLRLTESDADESSPVWTR